MKKRFTVYLLISMIIIGLSVGCSQGDEENENVKKEEYVPVEVQKTENKDLYNEMVLSGKIMADKNIPVFPQMMGIVKDIKVQVGDKVKKDDILFTLDSGEVTTQVNKAKNAMNQAKEAVNETKTALDNLYKTKKETTKKIEEAKSNLNRSKELYENGSIPKEQYKKMEMAVSKDPIKEIDEKINELQGAYEKANNGYQQAKKGYEEAQKVLNKMTIKSPIDGTVGSINIAENQPATNNNPSMMIVDLNKVNVNLQITESFINEIDTEKEVNIIIPSANDKEVKASIDSISPTPDMRTGLYPVKISFDNDGTIKQGMFAKVNMKTDIKENTLAIRSEAVVNKNDKNVVYVVNGNKAKEREVKLGLDVGEYVEVTKGLKEGEKVLVKGQNYVEDGSIIKVVRGGK